MVACHGGDPDAGLPVANHRIPLPAPASGYVSKCDAEAIGRACLLLGAGRAKITDSVDHTVGISDLKKVGEAVEKDEPLCIIHSNGHENAAELHETLASAFKISSNPVDSLPLVLEEIT